MSSIDYGDSKLNNLVERLRLRLVDYLVAKDVIPKDAGEDYKFTCINPDHEDKNPSCVLIPKARFKENANILLRCWSCGFTADCLRACAVIEDKPASGPLWIQDTVYYLAELLGEEYEKSDVVIDHERIKVLRLYSDAADCLIGLLRTSKKCDGFQHTSKRGLNNEICLEYGVGTVDWEEFFDTLQRYGPWEPSYILDNNITSNHFGTEFITVTLRDYRGQVVGFDRRFVYFDKEEESKATREKRHYPKKFMNSATSANETLRKIWQSGPFLYGLDKCSKNNWRRLDIVEGYFDVLSAVQAGHNSIVGSCGTSTLRDEHFDMLHALGFTEVAIVMDNDGPGLKASETCLEKFGKRGDIRLAFVRLAFDPADNVEEKNQDPDTFFRLYGMKNYLIMPVKSAFGFLMHLEKKRGARAEHLARRVIPQLAAEADGIARGNMIRELAVETGVHEEDIREEVDKIRSGHAQVILSDMKKSIERAGENDPTKIKAIVRDALDKMNTLSKDRVDLLSGKAATANLHRALDEFDNDKQLLAGWRTGIALFDEKMSGFRKRNFMVVGGNPNTGKSAIAHILMNGLVNHEANDQTLVYYSLDDPVGMSLAKQLSVETKMPIEWCARPQEFIYPYAERSKLYMEARDFYRSLMPHRLRVFGSEAGSTMTSIIAGVRRAEEETGNHVILVIDSFHLIHGEGSDEERAKFEKNSEKLHSLMHGGVTIIVTAECRKEAQGRRPRMVDLSETRSLSFDSNIVLMVYNDLHEKANNEGRRNQPTQYWVDKDPMTGESFRQEVLELTVEKNKTNGGYKGSAHYKMFRKHAHIEPIHNPNSFYAKEQNKWDTVRFGDMFDKDTGEIFESGPEVTLPT